MRRLAVLPLVLGALGCSERDDVSGPSATRVGQVPGAGPAGQAGTQLGQKPATNASGRNFTAHLSGDEEVPPRDTRATGQAVLHFRGGGARLEHRLIVASIENVVAAHVHCGLPGVNGPVGVTLFPGAGPGGGRVGGPLAHGTIAGPDPGNGCGWANLGDVLAAIQAGGAYVNVHTNDGVEPADTGPGDFRAARSEARSAGGAAGGRTRPAGPGRDRARSPVSAGHRAWPLARGDRSARAAPRGAPVGARRPGRRDRPQASARMGEHGCGAAGRGRGRTQPRGQASGGLTHLCRACQIQRTRARHTRMTDSSLRETSTEAGYRHVGRAWAWAAAGAVTVTRGRAPAGDTFQAVAARRLTAGAGPGEQGEDTAPETSRAVRRSCARRAA